MTRNVECAKCTKVVCHTKNADKAQSDCPTLAKRELINQAITEYDRPEIHEFARQACLQHNAAVMLMPEGYYVTRNPRV